MHQQAFFNEDGSGPAVYELQRTERVGHYRLLRRFSYRDPQHADWKFVVPWDLKGFETDLASVPALATWLVPRDGTHTPAALLHDALLGWPIRTPDGGVPIPRETADHVFRNAMRNLGVPFLRSWMMWAAVSAATLVQPGKSGRWRWIVVILLTGAVFGIGGILQIIDLFDVGILGRRWQLPWMGDRSAGQELLNALAVDFAAGVVTMALWNKWWQVGLVAVIALPLIAFPLAACGLTYMAYLVAETLLHKALKPWAERPGSHLAPVSPPPLVRRMEEKRTVLRSGRRSQ